MMEEDKGMMYLAPPARDIPRNLSFPLINENNFTLLRTQRTGLLRGPRRVLKLCVFALVVPSILIAIPLYVRLVLYPPGHYPMMPTDQRLLGRHVSGVWCQAQSTHMNGSFNTYMSHGFPGVERERRRHVMLHTMKMKDDIKEYWGFHFLQGSTITISTCARWDGAQVMILRGIENLRRCAWIGEEDSAEDMAEDDDIISEERLRIRDRLLKEEAARSQSGKKEKEEKDKADEGENDDSRENEDHSEERRKNIAQLLREAMKMSKDKSEILKILHNEGKTQDHIFHGHVSKGDTGTEINTKLNISQTILELENKTLSNQNDTIPTQEIRVGGLQGVRGYIKPPYNRKQKNQNPRAKRKRLRENRKQKKSSKRQIKTQTEGNLPREEMEISSRLKRFAEDDDTGGAFEELDTEDILDILLESKKDKEVNVSSVEMIIGGKIFYPEGLKVERGKFNQTTANDKSNEEHKSSYSSSEEALASCEGVILTLPLMSFKSCHFKNMGLNKITYDIPVTGTYYFVFSSDNEIYTNDLFFNLTMDRVVYDTNSSERICGNATDCSVPLSFWSDEQAVVEVPEEINWEHAYVLDTRCEPRVYVYLTLLLLVPLFIMCCAFQ